MFCCHVIPRLNFSQGLVYGAPLRPKISIFVLRCELLLSIKLLFLSVKLSFLFIKLFFLSIKFSFLSITKTKFVSCKIIVMKFVSCKSIVVKFVSCKIIVLKFVSCKIIDVKFVSCRHAKAPKNCVIQKHVKELCVTQKHSQNTASRSSDSLIRGLPDPCEMGSSYQPGSYDIQTCICCACFSIGKKHYGLIKRRRSTSEQSCSRSQSDNIDNIT